MNWNINLEQVLKTLLENRDMVQTLEIKSKTHLRNSEVKSVVGTVEVNSNSDFYRVADYLNGVVDGYNSMVPVAWKLSMSINYESLIFEDSLGLEFAIFLENQVEDYWL